MDLSELSDPQLAQASDTGRIAAALFVGLSNNDEETVRHLYLIIRRGVRNLMSGDCHSLQEDLIQDVFLTIYEAVHNRLVRCPEALLGFLHTVIRRKCGNIIADLVDSRNRLTGLSAGLHMEDTRERIEGQLCDEQRLRQVKSAIAQLSPPSRALLEDFYLRGMPRDTILARHNFSETQYRLNKSRGLQRVRKAVGSESGLNRGRTKVA